MNCPKTLEEIAARAAMTLGQGRDTKTRDPVHHVGAKVDPNKPPVQVDPAPKVKPPSLKVKDCNSVTTLLENLKRKLTTVKETNSWSPSYAHKQAVKAAQKAIQTVEAEKA